MAMNPHFWFLTAEIYVLLVSTVSCWSGYPNRGLDINPNYVSKVERAATVTPTTNSSSVASSPATGTNPYPTNAPFANVSSVNKPGNPCADDNFQVPVYKFSNLTVYKTFFNNNNTDPRFFFSTVNFTLRDVANNYSFRCNWGPRNPGAGPSWETQDCVPETGPIPDESRSLTLLNLWPEYLMLNKSSQDPVRIDQYWYCDIKNQSYPQVYQSKVEVFFNVTCPDRGTSHIDYPCDVSTHLPVIVNAQWQPTGALPGTPQLVPRPSPPVPATDGLDPPPDKDCTEISFAHPDWQLSNFSYTAETAYWEYETARLNLTLSSRATGTDVLCQFGGENTDVDGDQLIPVCSSESQQLESYSLFTLRFRGRDRWLYIQQDWVCGDVQGLRLTNFSATSELTVPAYCNDTGCLADPMTIRGSLTKPVSLTPAPTPAPPRANQPNCLANSQHPYNPIWTLTRFLYQTTKRGVDNFPGGGSWNGVLFPYNRTLEVELRNEANGFIQSCVFNDVTLDNITDRWWPCSYEKNPHVFPQWAIETYIQFNRDTGGFKVNQTWYCNDTQEATPFMITAHGSIPQDSSSLICGVSNSTALHVICETLFAPIYCDVLYSAQWCSLGGDRDGQGAPLGIRSSQTAVQRLPSNAFTDPDPEPGQWSCTISSLGHGPVIWKLQTQDYLTLTAWFGHWKSDQMYTKLRFNLSSSVFWGRPGGGVVRNIGTQESQGPDASALTPWLRGFDPTHTFHSGDRFANGYDADLGWDFYNVLDWNVRFDLSTGYMELNHSWYCDDKDPSRPIIFNGTWNGYIPLNCSYKFGQETPDFEDGIVCLLVGGDLVVTPTVTHITAETTIPDPEYGMAVELWK